MLGTRPCNFKIRVGRQFSGVIIADTPVIALPATMATPSLAVRHAPPYYPNRSSGNNNPRGGLQRCLRFKSDSEALLLNDVMDLLRRWAPWVAFGIIELLAAGIAWTVALN